MQIVQGDRRKCLQRHHIAKKMGKEDETLVDREMTITTHLAPSYTADGRLTHVHLHKMVRNVVNGSQSSRKYPCAVEDGMKGNRIVDRSMHGIDNFRLLVCALRTAPTTGAALSAAGCSARDLRGANEGKKKEHK